MTCHYPDMGNAFDSSCCEENLLQPLRIEAPPSYGLLVIDRYFISLESLNSSSSLKASFYRETSSGDALNVICFLGLFLRIYYKGGLGTTSYANKTG